MSVLSVAHEIHLFRHDAEGILVEAVRKNLVVVLILPEFLRIANGLLHAHAFTPHPVRDWTIKIVCI